MDRPPRFLYSKIVPRTAIRADGLKNADDFFDFLKACFIRCVFIEHAADGAERLTTAFTQQRLHRLLGELPGGRYPEILIFTRENPSGRAGRIFYEKGLSNEA